MKTYIVPVIHHVVFGCEVRVEAKNAKEAKAKAVELGGRAEVVHDGYDWDRMAFQRAELGDWGNVEEEES